MKTYLCPECGRELERGEKCPECGKVARVERFELRNSERRSRSRLFKVEA